jgi:hypothetical protein
VIGMIEMTMYKKIALTDIHPYEPGMEDGINDSMQPFIKTLEGDMIIPDGGYIATGIEGERWAIDKTIFAKTYVTWTRGSLTLSGCFEIPLTPGSHYMTPCKYCIHSRPVNGCKYSNSKGLIKVFNFV